MLPWWTLTRTPDGAWVRRRGTFSPELRPQSRNAISVASTASAMEIRPRVSSGRRTNTVFPPHAEWSRGRPELRITGADRQPFEAAVNAAAQLHNVGAVDAPEGRPRNACSWMLMHSSMERTCCTVDLSMNRTASRLDSGGVAAQGLPGLWHANAAHERQ